MNLYDQTQYSLTPFHVQTYGHMRACIHINLFAISLKCNIIFVRFLLAKEIS